MSDAFFETSDGVRIRLHDGATIGRLHSQDVTFDFPAMSRAHASVELRSGSWWILDHESRNGTFVNGARVTAEPGQLTDGDTLVFAGSVTVTFHDPAVTPIGRKRTRGPSDQA